MQYATDFRVESKTREQATYEALRRAIIQGRWGDNEPLVASRIASELGVSRITVANAFKRLSGEGFVRLVPHKEAIVAPLDPADIRQVYLMRAQLEGLSAREAATRVTPSDIVDLQKLNEEIGRLQAMDIRDVGDMRAVDLVFHRRLRLVSGMPLLASTLDNLADRSEGYRARVLDSNQMLMPTAERHIPILDALDQKQSELAESLMRHHVLEGLDMIMSMIDRP
ncbi:MAG: GntR family transcriptional regulator [Thermomicrobiales bacterium]